jgi:hypothetical protein
MQKFMNVLKKFLLWFTAIVIVLIIIGKFVGEDEPKLTPAQATRKDVIERAFSAWDGSHTNLTKVIKASMNNPKSYEHVETRYTDHGEYITIITEFRGENAFGGLVKNVVIAKAKLDGTIIEVSNLE